MTAQNKKPRVVVRHPIDLADAELEMDETRTELLTALAAQPSALGRVGFPGVVAARLLAYASIAAREDGVLQLAAQSLARSNASLLALSNAERGRPVTALLGEAMLTLSAWGPNSQAHVLAWRDGWYAALLARDGAALDLLSGIGDAALRASPSRADDFFYAWKAALIAHRQRPDAALPQLEQALMLTRKGRYHVAAPEAAQLMQHTFLLLGCVIRRDAAGFEGALLTALESHQRFWSAAGLQNDYDGWVALGPLALCCLAHDAGLPVNVESGYLLPFLIEGRASAARALQTKAAAIP